MPAYSFRGRVKHYVYLILVHFYLWGHLKTALYSAPIKNEKTLHQRIVYNCRTIRNRAGAVHG